MSGPGGVPRLIFLTNILSMRPLVARYMMYEGLKAFADNLVSHLVCVGVTESEFRDSDIIFVGFYQCFEPPFRC